MFDAVIRNITFLMGGFLVTLELTFFALVGGIALGALVAWLVVQGGFWLLSEPVARLAGLYQSDFALETLPLQLLLVLLLGGILLGLLGSWLAVGRHLDAIEPT